MKLSRSVPLLFVGNVASAAMGFALLFVMTRSLSVVEFGVFSALMGLVDLGVALVDALLMTGMVQVVARHRVNDPGRAAMATKISLLLRLPVLAVILMIPFVAGAQISGVLFGENATREAVIVACVTIALLSMASFFTAQLQSWERFRLVALVTLLKNGLRLALIGSAAYLGVLDPHNALLLVALAAALAALVSGAVTPLRISGSPGFDPSVLRELMAVNGWIAVAAIGFLGARIDILMLSSLSGPAEPGYYAAAVQLCVAITLLSTAVGTALFPRTAQLEDPTAMRAHLTRALMILPLGLVCAAVLPFAVGWLVPLLLGADYAPVETPFKLLAASALITLFTNPILLLVFPLRLLPAYAAVILLQLVIRVVANAFTIPAYGADAAAANDLLAKVITIALLGGAIAWKVYGRRGGGGLVPQPD